MSSETKTFITDIKRLLTQPAAAQENYFHVTRLANANGELLQSVDSHWIGYTSTRPRREIRVASALDGAGRRADLHSIGEHCLLLNDEHDYRLWLAFGGHAVFAESIIRIRLPELLLPIEVAHASGAVGFIAAQSLADCKRQHAPSKVTRMKVRNRDARRCFICGRSPMNNVDIELHVHHLVPWGAGGITEIENLVTLCGTCHDWLDPHFDWPLVFDVKAQYYARTPTYREQLQNYQETIRRLFRQDTTPG